MDFTWLHNSFSNNLMKVFSTKSTLYVVKTRLTCLCYSKCSVLAIIDWLCTTAMWPMPYLWWTWLGKPLQMKFIILRHSHKSVTASTRQRQLLRRIRFQFGTYAKLYWLLVSFRRRKYSMHRQARCMAIIKAKDKVALMNSLLLDQCHHTLSQKLQPITPAATINVYSDFRWLLQSVLIMNLHCEASSLWPLRLLAMRSDSDLLD